MNMWGVRGEGHRQEVHAIILAYFNLQIRLTSAQINLKYYVIWKSRRNPPPDRMFKQSDVARALSSWLFTNPTTHVLQQALLIRWNAFVRVSLAESWLQMKPTASVWKWIPPDLTCSHTQKQNKKGNTLFVFAFSITPWNDKSWPATHYVKILDF